MSAFPPRSTGMPSVNIGLSASTAAANAAAGAEASGMENGGPSSTSATASTRTTNSVPDMSSIISDGGELYGSMMVGSLPAMGGGLGKSAPPSPELGPVPSAHRSGPAGPAHHSRAALMSATRIVVKAGTSIVSNPRGYPCLSRIGAVVEQCAWLKKMGKEVILVSSGAVGVGRQMLRKQQLLHTSMGAVLDGHAEVPKGTGRRNYDSACAAAGQLGLMSLYETLFAQCDVATSQLLVTEFDFRTPERRRHLRYTTSTMLKLGVVPILNENDAVSGNEGYEADGMFSDNDGLAALVAEQMNAKALILLTDVEGVFNKHPDEEGAKIFHTFDPHRHELMIGEKSAGGRGGMGAKIRAASRAVIGGVQSVVIASGLNPYSIERIVCGEKVGTMFCANPGLYEDSEDEDNGADDMIVKQAEGARVGGRMLCALDSEERAGILRKVAEALLSKAPEITVANEKDIKAAEANNIAPALLNRLKLTEDKIKVLADGISSLADGEEPLSKCNSRLEVQEGLVLKQITSPIGVLLIVFESRPDSLPQIASLAIRSGNGLLLKGGKEAEFSNACLHRIIVDAVAEGSKGRVSRDCIGLVTSRAAVGELLKLDHLIDLVIPRGSGALVNHIKASTKIPVMGHSEGICHVYIDKAADPTKAAEVAVDAKVNYPSACNAAETILIHKALLEDGVGTCSQIVRALHSAGVTVLGGPRAVDLGVVGGDKISPGFKTEYGDLTVTLEIVDSVEAALDHIQTYGSSHTDTIVTEDEGVAKMFLETVDSACVFHNASTRFSDGYRFGLGAEVGVSTGRIHARGPVGVEGLLTTKWVLRSHGETAHTVGRKDPYSLKPMDPEPGAW
eukprot:g12814.t1